MTRLVTLLLGLLVVAFQITLAQFLAFTSGKPDFVLLFVLVRGLSRGSTAGVIWGFSLGLLLDSVSGNLTGLGSLAYSLVGFIGGQIGAGKTMTRLQFFLTLWFTVMIAHALIFYLVEPWKQVGFGEPFLHRSLPGILLTLGLGLLWMASPLSHKLIERKHG